jgi:hypothetical protein
VLLLCQAIERDLCRRRRLEQVPDAAGEVALEAADGVALGLAFGFLADDVVLGLGVAAGTRDGCGRDARDDRPAAADRAPGPPAPRSARSRSRPPMKPGQPRPRRSGRSCRACGWSAACRPSTASRRAHGARPRPFTSGCWTPGGQGLLRALPRSYQVTPNIPDRRRATQQRKSGHSGRQPQRESARRPVGTISSASDVTDHRIETASLEGAVRRRWGPRTVSLPPLV